jgi:predicted nucleotidyltransferase
MKFKVDYREGRDARKLYPNSDFEIAKTFSTKLYKEFGDFVKAIVLFGSATKGKKKSKPNDIDILVIVDDVRIHFNEDIVQTYRIIAQKIIADVDPDRLHVQSMKFSSFWEYTRAGDPVATNILRYGIALIDTGFFDPLQMLLDQGRIRPTPESISTYFHMAPANLDKSDSHLMQAAMELYWCVVNSAHAALMHYGEIPPSPKDVPKIMQRTLVKDKLVSKEAVKVMSDMHQLYKDITTRKKRDFTGKDFDLYRKKAQKFMNEMEKFIRKKR